MSLNLLASSEEISATRREFLRNSFGTLVASSTMRGVAHATATLRPPKTILVTFGGGARDEETFAEDGQENIPNLLHTLLPQGTFFSHVVNAGILGHHAAG